MGYSNTQRMTDWKNKLLAYLHDPPSSPLRCGLSLESRVHAAWRESFSKSERNL